MASVNISEEDFTQVAGAANDAKERGDVKSAQALDKLARKINAALSYNAPMAKIARAVSGRKQPITWRDMPTTLQD